MAYIKSVGDGGVVDDAGELLPCASLLLMALSDHADTATAAGAEFQMACHASPEQQPRIAAVNVLGELDGPPCALLA